MADYFTPGGNRSGNFSLPGATSAGDSPGVTYNTGKYFNRVNKSSNNKMPSGFNSSAFSKGYNTYANAIGMKESNNNYKATGQMMTSGRHKGTRAWGKYQFMPATLEGLGGEFKGLNEKQFLGNPGLQDRAMRALTAQNAKGLGIDLKNLKKGDEELLSTGHYAGYGAALKLKNKGYSSSDSNTQWGTGTPHPSKRQYSTAISQAMTNYYKPASLNKALNIFNKLIKGE